MGEIPEAKLASTVVLLRDTDDGLETLMLRRNKALIFAGGAWVFPGGSVDPEDFDKAGGDIALATRVAAAREAMEESGLSPDLDEMVLLSQWTTPVGEPRRFATWIYAAPLAADDEVVIDGGEIHDHRWLTVRDAVAEHEAGELNMLPPTYFTLSALARHDTVADMIASERVASVPELFPKFGADSDQILVMFRGDAGYESGDVTAPGPRHRAVLEDVHWRYYHVDVDPQFPPLIPAAEA
jgi:8-oxo-dGTP pyrophosphatase MutT (NUDIX family)